MENMDQIYLWIIDNGIKLLGAIAFLIIGFFVTKLLVKRYVKIVTKKNMDPALISFTKSLVNVGLKVLVIVSVMGMVGIEMTSFIAVLGAAGLAVGLAFQGTLSNFAGGVMIIIFKPYKVGEFIEAQGYTGSVADIQIFNTILNTPDNKVVIIPNGGLATGSLINFTRKETRRVDWSFGVGYGSDYKAVREIIIGLIENDDRILKDPNYFIGLGEMADSSVNITTRAWVKTADYWDVYFDINEKVYKIFNEKGIEIPFPQMDVHIKKD